MACKMGNLTCALGVHLHLAGLQRVPGVSWSAGPPGVDPADNDGKPQTAWQKVKRFFGGDKLDRQRLAALGLGAVASYGFVSNVTYGECTEQFCCAVLESSRVHVAAAPAFHG